MRALLLLSLAWGAAAAAAAPEWDPAQLALPAELDVRLALEAAPRLQAAHESVATGEALAQRYRSGPHEWEVSALAQQRTDPAGIVFSEQEYGIQRAVRWPWKFSLDRRLGEKAVEVGELSYVDAWHEGGRLLLDLWFEWLEAERAAGLLSEQMPLVQQQQFVVARRIEAGDAARLELQMAEAETARLQASLSAAEQRAASARETMAALFPALPLDLPARLPQPEALTGTEQDWIDRITGGNHEIELAEARASEDSLLAERAGRNRLADPQLGLRYSDNLDGNQKVVGLQFTLPIGGGSRSAEAALARSASRASQALATEARARVEADARIVVGAARLGLRSWENLRLAQQQAQRSATAAARGYELGELDIMLLIESRRRALAAQLDLDAAQLQALRSRARVLLDAHELWAPAHHEDHGDHSGD
jgi:hypothetical protein